MKINDCLSIQQPNQNLDSWLHEAHHNIYENLAHTLFSSSLSSSSPSSEDDDIFLMRFLLDLGFSSSSSL